MHFIDLSQVNVHKSSIGEFRIHFFEWGKTLKKSIPRSQGKTKQKSVRRSKKNYERYNSRLELRTRLLKINTTIFVSIAVIFSMMRFESATSSFLALLEIKSYRTQLKVQNSKKVSTFRSEKEIKTLATNDRYTQIRTKILKTIANFNKILLKFVMFISSEAFDCLKRLSIVPISSLKQFQWLIKIHKLGT